MKKWIFRLSFIALSALPITFQAEEITEMPRGEQREDTVPSLEPIAFLNPVPQTAWHNNEHWITSITSNGDEITVEDGSVWKVAPRDRSEALQWAGNVPILLSQNTNWFSSYKYRLINGHTYGAVEVNLKLMPFEEGSYTQYITALDPRKGTVRVTDGSEFQIFSFDSRAYQKWQVGDMVFLGTNGGWFSFRYPLIVVNLTLKETNFARAKEL